MGSHRSNTNKQKTTRQRILARRIHFHPRIVAQFWKKLKLWQKILTVILTIVFLCIGTMYGIARWYIYEERNVPLTLGVTFISDYAKYFGLDPQQTMQAMIDQLHVKNFRLVSYWSDIEATKGHYDFSDLDWQFQMAEKAHAQVILSIGLRQPRWPECHMPTWAENEPYSVWYPQLKDFMTATIERYKNSPALGSYQLENEYFLKVFGTCQNYDRSRLVDEFNLVKKLDNDHPVIISRSNNAIGLPIGNPVPDEYGVSVYKRVWDKNVTHRYFEYPFPAWFYGFLAGGSEILSGRNMIIHELQAEPWPPTGITQASIAEQDKSMDATRLQSRFQYGEATGVKTIYLWGAEWWYYRLIKDHDPSLWNVAKTEFNNAAAHNQQLLNQKSPTQSMTTTTKIGTISLVSTTSTVHTY
jgi:hypothetical protein